MRWLWWFLGCAVIGVLVWFYFLGEKETKAKMALVRQAKADKKLFNINDNDDGTLRNDETQIKSESNQ